MNMLFIVAGPVSTNTYLIADPATLEAAVIDPAWKGGRIAAEAKKRGWKIRQIWVTHAHSDHIDGVADLVDALDDAPLIGLSGSPALARGCSGFARAPARCPVSPWRMACN